MLLIIMRHGEAAEYSTSDRCRMLTNTGVQQSQNVGKWLMQNMPKINVVNQVNEQAPLNNDLHKPHIDLALVSPYVRTVETCRNVAKFINIGQQTTSDTFTPMADVTQAADIVHGFASQQDAPNSILIVTHMPLVSMLASVLCGDNNGDYFAPADTLVIDYEARTGRGLKHKFYRNT